MTKTEMMAALRAARVVRPRPVVRAESEAMVARALRRAALRARGEFQELAA